MSPGLTSMGNTKDVTLKLYSKIPLQGELSAFWILQGNLLWLILFPGQCLHELLMPGWVLAGPLPHLRQLTPGSPGTMVLAVAPIRLSTPSIFLWWHLGSCCDPPDLYLC